jgi:hypothetical protein
VGRVLHVAPQDLEAVDLGGERARDRRVLHPAALRDQRRRTRRVRLDHRLEAHVPQQVQHLAERHRVAVRAADGLERRAPRREQAVLHPLEVLAHHRQAALGQEAVDVGHAAGDRVLAGEHGEPRLPVAHGGHRRLEGGAGQGGPAREGMAAGEVRVGAGQALEGDGAAAHAKVLVSVSEVRFGAPGLPMAGGASMFRPGFDGRQARAQAARRPRMGFGPGWLSSSTRHSRRC